MGINIPIVSGIIEFFTTWAKNKAELSKVKAEGAILVATTQAKAEATVLIKRAESVADWELAQANASAESWKDEFWTVVLAIPATLAFIPFMSPYIEAGFYALATMPEWYMWALLASISASFGIRFGIFDATKSLASNAASTVKEAVTSKREK